MCKLLSKRNFYEKLKKVQRNVLKICPKPFPCLPTLFLYFFMIFKVYFEDFRLDFLRFLFRIFCSLKQTDQTREISGGTLFFSRVCHPEIRVRRRGQRRLSEDNCETSCGVETLRAKWKEHTKLLFADQVRQTYGVEQANKLRIAMQMTGRAANYQAKWSSRLGE